MNIRERLELSKGKKFVKIYIPGTEDGIMCDILNVTNDEVELVNLNLVKSNKMFVQIDKVSAVMIIQP